MCVYTGIKKNKRISYTHKLFSQITYNNYSYMSITIQFSTQHSRNRISQVCTAHRDVRQFSTPWQVNICMLIGLRNFCRGRMRRKEHGGTIDGGWKIHLHVTKEDARQSRESKCHHGQGDKMREREKGEARKARRRETLSRGSREMNHIIMNNNMPYPWCSLCLVINSNDLAGDFTRIVGVVCRVKHALLPCVTPHRPARTLPLLL